MSKTIWLRRNGGYSLSINPKQDYGKRNALIYVACPGGNISFSIEREAVVRFVEKLQAALIPEEGEGE